VGFGENKTPTTKETFKEDLENSQFYKIINRVEKSIEIVEKLYDDDSVKLEDILNKLLSTKMNKQEARKYLLKKINFFKKQNEKHKRKLHRLYGLF
jgi:hypothetical protein